MTVVSKIQVLTVSGFSIPGLPTEPSYGIDAETGTDIGDVPHLSMLITAIGVWSTVTQGQLQAANYLNHQLDPC